MTGRALFLGNETLVSEAEHYGLDALRRCGCITHCAKRDYDEVAKLRHDELTRLQDDER